MATKKKPNQSQVRRGWRSTEFWLTALTSLVGLLVLAGIVDLEGTSTLDKTVGLVVAALTSMGYSISRGLAKAKASDAE